MYLRLQDERHSVIDMCVEVWGEVEVHLVILMLEHYSWINVVLCAIVMVFVQCRRKEKYDKGTPYRKMKTTV